MLLFSILVDKICKLTSFLVWFSLFEIQNMLSLLLFFSDFVFRILLQFSFHLENYFEL